MGIYTKKGDKGDTSLYGGSSLSKGSLRVESYGSVDEANATLGVIFASLEFEELKEIVRVMQKKMFIVGAQLASDEDGYNKLKVKIENNDIEYLEKIIDYYTNEYGQLTGFTIPGETVVSSQFHIARTVVRRSERLVVNLSKEEFVCPLILKYLNRLSDTLFILARAEVHKSFIKKVVDKVYEKTTENPTTKSITKQLIDKMCSAVLEESHRLNVPVSFSVADSNGNLLYFTREDKAILPSIEIAQNKAYTSAVMKMSTEKLGVYVKSGNFYGLGANNPRLILFGGGQCLQCEGNVIGGIGVSGGSEEEDITIGNKAVEVFNKFF